jgi:hypothetical protein
MSTVKGAVAILLLCTYGDAFAAEPAANQFLSTLTKPAAISTFTINPEHYSKLSQQQRQNVLSAKAVLDDFFRALESKDSNVKKLLAANFPNRNLSTQGLRQTLVSDETSIIQLGVSDFEYSHDDMVLNLEFYAVTLSDGTFSAGKGRATMTMGKEGWRIATIKIAS